jgi:hypothetical protein
MPGEDTWRPLAIRPNCEAMVCSSVEAPAFMRGKKIETKQGLQPRELLN